jgi:hypothetical protein
VRALGHRGSILYRAERRIDGINSAAQIINADGAARCGKVVRVKPTWSKVVFGMSCVIAALTLAATAWWIAMVVALHSVGLDSDRQWAGWGMIGFIYLVGPVLGGLALLFGVIPSAMVYARQRQQRDLWSLGLASASLLAVVLETAVFLLPAIF